MGVWESLQGGRHAPKWRPGSSPHSQQKGHPERAGGRGGGKHAESSQGRQQRRQQWQAGDSMWQNGDIVTRTRERTTLKKEGILAARPHFDCPGGIYSVPAIGIPSSIWSALLCARALMGFPSLRSCPPPPAARRIQPELLLLANRDRLGRQAALTARPPEARRGPRRPQAGPQGGSTKASARSRLFRSH